MVTENTAGADNLKLRLIIENSEGRTRVRKYSMGKLRIPSNR